MGEGEGGVEKEEGGKGCRQQVLSTASHYSDGLMWG